MLVFNNDERTSASWTPRRTNLNRYQEHRKLHAVESCHAELAPDAQRLRAVENGLLPALVTPRTVPLRLQDRMEQLQVPGVSVAVVDHGRLAWAYAPGLTLRSDLYTHTHAFTDRNR